MERNNIISNVLAITGIFFISMLLSSLTYNDGVTGRIFPSVEKFSSPVEKQFLRETGDEYYYQFLDQAIPSWCDFTSNKSVAYSTFLNPPLVLEELLLFQNFTTSYYTRNDNSFFNFGTNHRSTFTSLATYGYSPIYSIHVISIQNSKQLFQKVFNNRNPNFGFETCPAPSVVVTPSGRSYYFIFDEFSSIGGIYSGSDLLISTGGERCISLFAGSDRIIFVGEENVYHYSEAMGMGNTFKHNGVSGGCFNGEYLLLGKEEIRAYYLKGNTLLPGAFLIAAKNFILKDCSFSEKNPEFVVIGMSNSLSSYIAVYDNRRASFFGLPPLWSREDSYPGKLQNQISEIKYVSTHISVTYWGGGDSDEWSPYPQLQIYDSHLQNVIYSFRIGGSILFHSYLRDSSNKGEYFSVVCSQTHHITVPSDGGEIRVLKIRV